MTRAAGFVVLMALTAYPLDATAEGFRADAASQARMARYFSNIPIGGPSSPSPVMSAEDLRGPAGTSSYGARMAYAAADPPSAEQQTPPTTRPRARAGLPTEIGEDAPIRPKSPRTGPLEDLPNTATPRRLEAPSRQPAASGTQPPTQVPSLDAAGPKPLRTAPPMAIPDGDGAGDQAPPAKSPRSPAAKALPAEAPMSEVPAETPHPKALEAKPEVPEAPARLPKAEPKEASGPLPTDPAYRPQPPKTKKPAPAEPPIMVEEIPEEDHVWTSDEPGPAAETCEPCAEAACGAPGRFAWLDPRNNPLGLQLGGWLDQGVTINAYSPRGRSNFPVTFNDRSNDYQLNQFYLFLERPCEADGFWHVGGRVDLLYGTDQIYVTSRGLERFQDGQPKWNSDEGPVGTNYGLAMPQLYMEAFAPWGNGLSVKIGHFYTIMGYEVVKAPENYFYSHSYAFQYGEPLTHTGVLAACNPTDALKLQAGLTRGWDSWENNNNALGFLGGLTWKLPNEQTTLALTVHTGPEADERPRNSSFRTVYSLVLDHKFNDRLTYVLQHDYGFEPRPDSIRGNATWYGIDQYLLYKVNPLWAAGLRLEWFHDGNGERVRNGLQGGIAGDYFELTAGLNWTPRERLVVRPELRWDWAANTDAHPFADGTRDHQLLLAVDMIVNF
jgi:hypothetical protein